MTGLTTFQWLLLATYACAVALLVRSALAGPPATRVARFTAVPCLAGVGLAVALYAVYPHDTRDALSRLPDRAAALAGAGAVIVVAAALADFLFTRVVAVAVRAAPGRARRTTVGDGAFALVLAAAIAVAFVALDRVAPPSSGSVANVASADAAAVGEHARVIAEYEVGDVSDILPTGPRAGYLALADGRLARYVLPPSTRGHLSLRTLLSGLPFPRGLALAHGRLYVSTLGRLPCTRAQERVGLGQEQCKGENIDPHDIEKGDERIIRATRGAVLSYAVRPDGALTDRRTVLANLPVANTQHGVNGLARGADGYLYLAIGNLDYLYHRRGIAHALTPRPNLLGTIVRFAPGGSRLEVYARGLRNVYGLAFDHRGHLFAADNDGPTWGAWRMEELDQIRRGSNFGFPEEGTFGPHPVPRDPPVWLMDSGGSAGIEWAGDVGLPPGVLVGSCGQLTYVPLALRDGRAYVADDGAVRALANPAGCIASIRPGPRGTVLVGLVPAKPGAASLLVLRLSD